ncbi:unnamed protein product [Urochloa decumbens]|uniref:Uncharacterized protein n=1 Tax=Urochloa decumbens TaxID=240449 RepID=A0ABC8VCZ1_9POAL
MAVASAWAKPGSWALAAEEQDELPPLPPPVVPAADFPDLATAATTKVPKKKKPQSMPLSDFNNGKFVARASRGPGPEVATLDLPTGPRERTEEELANTRGFGATRWGGAGGGPRGSDEPRRGGSDREDFGPSRADEADDWGAGKKPLERRERMGGFGGDSSASRADDVVDWVSTKKTTPAPFPERRERVGGGFGGDSRADDSANWGSNKSYSAPPPMPADGRRGGPVWGFNRDGVPDADSWGRRREEMSNGGASSVGRPRLNLQKRTLPLANGSDGEKQEDNKDNKEDEKEEQRPRSRSSNPFGAARPREEVLAAKGEDWKKEEPKVEKLDIQPRTRSSNPFGAARPREEVLAEKGEDWRKIDEKLEAMKVREAPPEMKSFGKRGSPDAGEENGNGQLPDARAERAWKKPEAVEAAKESEEGSDEIADGSALAN